MNQDAVLKKKDKISGFDLALNYLGYKSRTEKEVADYLEKKKFDKNEILEIIGKLKYYQYINDENYLLQAVRTNASVNQYGRLRLKQNLRQHGLTEKILSQFEAVYTENLEVQCAKAQLEKANKKYCQELPSKRYQKMVAMLQRKGFSYELIRSLMSQITFEGIEDDSAAASRNAEECEKHYQKYYRMQSRKGYTGRELKQRIIRNLMSKGYSYDTVKKILEKHSESFDED